MPYRSTIRVCIVVITLILMFSVLKYADQVFAPMLLALVLGVVLSPLSDLWEHLRLPAAASALLSVTISLSVLVVLAFLLEPVITDALDNAPVIWAELRSTIEEIQRMMRGIDQITEDVAAAIAPNSGSEREENITIPTITDALLSAPKYAGQVMIFIGTLYFFLLSRLDVYAWVGSTFNRLNTSHLRQAERRVSRYFLTITMINAVFAIVIAVVMHLLGMPSPMLFGVLAFLFNYVLYLGPALLTFALLLTGIVTFDGAYSFLPALLYLGLNMMEGQFFTPGLIGKSLSVNPLLVFLSLVFWLWLWGPAGGFIAIPLLIWVIVVIEGLLGHTISSGIPGKLRPNRLAGPAE